MAASMLVEAGSAVTLFEARSALGRKILVAGSSGLNISYEGSDDEARAAYGVAWPRIAPALQGFSQEKWVSFIRGRLSTQTFLGTSRRYFVKDMKAAIFLKRWISYLRERGVTFETASPLTDFSPREGGGVALSFAGGAPRVFDAAVFALGGGSWEDPGEPRWPALFSARGFAIIPFRQDNVGYSVDPWPAALVKEADREPLKDAVLTTARGSKRGDVLLTEYGIEGTPVYWVGCEGAATLDLAPHFTTQQLAEKLAAGKENLAPMRRVKKNLKLSPAAQALLFHLTPEAERTDPMAVCRRIKALPLRLSGPRPLAEAISSAGGLSWDEVDDSLQLKRLPGIFVAGEMLDWTAPTGGYLIQACVSLGAAAAAAIIRSMPSQP